MDLNVEELDDVKRKLNIKVPGDVVSSRIKKAYRDLNTQIKMPGFRPGKIPQKILEKQVPLEALTQLWQDLMQEYYEKALTESGIKPAGPPEIDHSGIKELKRDEPLTFSVLLDIKPSFTYTDYKGMKFKKKEHQVSEADLELAINKHLEPFGEFVDLPEGQEVNKGDYVLMDFEGFLGPEKLDNGSARDYKVRLGEKKMIEGFEEQIAGHKAGEEFEVKVKLPSNWDNKVRRVSMPIPGKEQEETPDVATFKVKLKKASKMKLPELTDALVQKHGEASVESFKTKLRAQIQGIKDQAEELRIKQEIFDQLAKKYKVKPPESLIKQELKFMIEGMKYQIEQSGMKFEDSGFDPEQAEQEWRPKAENDAKGYMILDSIANQENIHATQTDLDEEYQRLAQETGKKVEEVKERLFSNPEHMHQTTQRVRGRKALNFIYSHCEFEFTRDDGK